MLFFQIEYSRLYDNLFFSKWVNIGTNDGEYISSCIRGKLIYEYNFFISIIVTEYFGKSFVNNHSISRNVKQIKG